jgi:signal transduction histidine kinase
MRRQQHEQSMIRTLRSRAHHLRWKLVAGFTISVALLLALLTGAERVLIERSLTNDVTQNLTAAANQALRTLPSVSVVNAASSGTSVSPAIGSGFSEQIMTIKGLDGFITNLAAQDQPSALLDANGAVLSSSVMLSHDRSSTGSLDNGVLSALVASATPHLTDKNPWMGKVSTPDGNYQAIVWPIASLILDGYKGGTAIIPPQSFRVDPLPGSAGVMTGKISVAANETRNTLILAHSLAATEQTIQTVTMITLAGALVVLALTIILGLLVVRSALRPLSAITGGAERLAQGDYAYRLAARPGTDEVGRLASAFDHMAGAIGEAFTTQRRFVADASHELRTPLTALRGYTDVLLLGVRDDPETADRVLRAMQDDLTRMTRLVNDLLVLARLDGNAPLEVRPIVLQPVVDAARQEATMLAGDRHAINVEMDHEPLEVVGDRDRLRQVLSNVLGNAIAYATPNTPIQLALARQGASARISVKDQGPGMAPWDVERLGERFYRGDSARSRQTGGTGLGLAIARGIVRAHGGSLTIESAVGRGTTVTVLLPLMQARRI